MTGVLIRRNVNIETRHEEDMCRKPHKHGGLDWCIYKVRSTRSWEKH
jgi:hypothetical protein